MEQHNVYSISHLVLEKYLLEAVIKEIERNKMTSGYVCILIGHTAHIWHNEIAYFAGFQMNHHSFTNETECWVIELAK